MAKKASFSEQAAFSLEVALFVVKNYYGESKLRWFRGLHGTHSTKKSGYSGFNFWPENNKKKALYVTVFCSRENDKSDWEPVKGQVWGDQELLASYFIEANPDDSFRIIE